MFTALRAVWRRIHERNQLMSRLRIDRVEIHKAQWLLPDLGEDAYTSSLIYAPNHSQQVSTYAIRVWTNEGVCGEYVGGNSVAATQIGMVGDYLIGKDPLQRERIYNDVKRTLRKYDKMGMGPLDIALWDLAGKYYGAPIYELLGGWRTRLPSYASTLGGDRAGGLDCPQAYAEFAVHCRDIGYPAFKVHVWEDYALPELVQTIGAVRTAVGDSMQLMLDPASKVNTFAEAWRLGRACDDNGYLWLEDPYKDTGISVHGHQQLKALIRTPLLVTEHVRGLEQHVDFIVSGATDFVRVDPEYDGGITGAMKIAHAAEGLGLDVEIHSPGPAHRHLMAALRNTNYYEMSLVHPKTREIGRSQDIYADEYYDALDAVDHNGCVSVPQGAGLGVQYDWDTLMAHCVDTREFT